MGANSLPPPCSTLPAAASEVAWMRQDEHHGVHVAHRGGGVQRVLPLLVHRAEVGGATGALAGDTPAFRQFGKTRHAHTGGGGCQKSIP